jgi:hypothetical protein
MPQLDGLPAAPVLVIADSPALVSAHIQLVLISARFAGGYRWIGS